MFLDDLAGCGSDALDGISLSKPVVVLLDYLSGSTYLLNVNTLSTN